MIRSMTAYAGGERVTPWGTLGCELRSVNHRFLEVGVRLPEELRAQIAEHNRTHFIEVIGLDRARLVASALDEVRSANE